MRNNRKLKQREEVRDILHAMRLELAAQRLARQNGTRREPALHLDKFMSDVCACLPKV